MVAITRRERLDPHVVTNKGVRSIAADGKTMTIKVVAIAQNGQETPITLVFKRVSP